MDENSKRTYVEAKDDQSRSFLVDDYKLKVDYLTAHFGRMWTRFNFFLTVELAIFGFLGYLLFDTQGRDPRAVPVPITLGILVSLVWVVVSIQDRVLVDRYRNDVRGVAAILSKKFNGLGWYQDYYVGSGKGAPKPYHLLEQRQSWVARLTDRLLFSLYWEALSITRLPAILSLLLVVVWIIVLAMWFTGSWVFSESWQPITQPSPTPQP